MLQENQILWDVVEEHLDEAAFLVGQWCSARLSPSYTLSELREGPQERLMAHVDGLVVNGPCARERLVLPVLENQEDDFERAAAAMLTAMECGDFQALHLLAKLEETDEALSAHAQGIVAGLGLSQHPKLSATLRSHLTEHKGTDLIVRLTACAYRGVDPGQILDTTLRSDDPRLVVASLRAVSNAPKARYLSVVESLLQHPNPEVLSCALTAALRWGSRGAWELAIARATRLEPQDPLAMVWCASMGDERHAEALAKHLDNDALRNDALWALGFSGYRSAVESCMPYLAHDDDTTRRLAGEAVGAILGLDPDDDTLWESPVPEDPAVAGDDPSQDDDDLDEDLELQPVDDLPLPNSEAIELAWKERAGSWKAKVRWMGGKPLEGSVASLMREAPCRRLDALADEALARSSSPTARWPSRAHAQEQLDQIRSMV